MDRIIPKKNEEITIPFVIGVIALTIFFIWLYFNT